MEHRRMRKATARAARAWRSSHGFRLTVIVLLNLDDVDWRAIVRGVSYRYLPAAGSSASNWSCASRAMGVTARGHW
jgi:hypothetical protein